MFESLIELVRKEMENPTKSCKACKSWGGCPPGRPRGPQPTGWLVKPDPHPIPKVAAQENDTDAWLS